MKTKLSLGTVREIDSGKIRAAFDKELERVVQDCMDRPGDDRERKVMLMLSVTPECSAEGTADTCIGEFQVKSHVPPRQSKRYQMALHPNGSAFFNPESSDDISQGTIDEVIPNRRRRED